MHGGEVVSVAEPSHYARRFWHSMQAMLADSGGAAGGWAPL